MFIKSLSKTANRDRLLFYARQTNQWPQKLVLLPKKVNLPEFKEYFQRNRLPLVQFMSLDPSGQTQLNNAILAPLLKSGYVCALMIYTDLNFNFFLKALNFFSFPIHHFSFSLAWRNLFRKP
jgi:hypothetical protein